jgi:hypothetical protein
VDWLVQGNWERVVLVLSLLGNSVLIVALFFKSALNDIVSHWYKERLKRKDKIREILLELGRHMVTLQRDYLLMLLGLGLQQMATTAADRKFADKAFNYAGKSLKAANDFMDKHDLEFPQSIRDVIAELRRAMQLPAGAVGQVLAREEVLGQSDAVKKATERIRTEVRRIVGE